MGAPFPAIDVGAMSDDDFLHLTAAPKVELEAKGAAPAPIDVGKMSDDAFLAMQKGGPQKPAAMGTGEAASRLFYKHLTFGAEPGADKARSEQAAHEHPYVDYASMVPAMVAQTAALGPLAVAAKGVQGAGYLANAARGAGKALEYTMLPNAEANTALLTGRTAAKLSGNYSAAEALGSDLTNPNKTWSDVAYDVPTSYALGTAAGAVLGPAIHGISRGVGAVANRAMPELRDVAAAARAPETQGARDVMRQAGYDNYTPKQMAELRAQLSEAELRATLAGDPAAAGKYADLNLIEAMEAGNLKPMPGTDELKPEVRVSPNLRDQAQDWANTGGVGRQQAIDAFANRRNEMSAKIQGDVDRVIAGQKGAPEAEELATLIDRHLGSGQRATDAELLAARKEAFDTRFSRLREKPLLMTDQLGELHRNSPTFQAAVQHAAELDAAAKAMRAVKAGEAPSGAAAMKPWITGQADAGADGTGRTWQIFSPSNLLDIHHQLYLAAKPKVGGDLSAEMRAGQVKRLFSDWVDNNFKGYKDLNNDYRLFKSTMDASEHGSNLSLTGGGPKDKAAMTFLDEAKKGYDAVVKDVQRRTAQYDAAMERYQAGKIKNPPAKTELTKAYNRATAQGEMIAEFRKAQGESWKEQFQRSTNPDALVKQLATPAGQQRIMRTLGDKDGPVFMDNLLAMEARRRAMEAPINPDAAHAANQFYDRLVREGREGPLQAFRVGRAEKIKAELARASSSNAAGVNSVVDKLLTQAGKEHLLKIFGPKQGRELIESLYSKQLQGGLSKTLYGGSDTAHKMARHKKTDALVDAVYSMNPLHPRPMEFLNAMKTLGSARFAQNRADQGNLLLSQQGPEKVGRILDAMLAQHQLQTTAHPYVRNPAVRAIGPVGAVENVDALLNQNQPPPPRRRQAGQP